MKEKISDYLLDHVETLKEITKAINYYDGSLDWLEYYENDEEFFDTFYYKKPYEVARAICYGSYTYTDEYVNIDVYGNLNSCSEWDLEDELKSSISDIVDRLIELYYQIKNDFNDTEVKDLIEEGE